MGDILKMLPKPDVQDAPGPGAYMLNDILALPGVRVLEPADGAYLAVKDDGRSCIYFALFEWTSESDSGVGVDCIFHGCGTGGPLRELRHMWWGDDDGYIFYLSIGKVGKALAALGEFFDD